MDHILQRLHDSEINATVATFYDGVFIVKLGDEWNGYVAEGTAPSWTEAAKWLEEMALRYYPHSDFASKHSGTNVLKFRAVPTDKEK